MALLELLRALAGELDATARRFVRIEDGPYTVEEARLVAHVSGGLLPGLMVAGATGDFVLAGIFTVLGVQASRIAIAIYEWRRA